MFCRSSSLVLRLLAVGCVLGVGVITTITTTATTPTILFHSGGARGPMLMTNSTLNSKIDTIRNTTLLSSYHRPMPLADTSLDSSIGTSLAVASFELGTVLDAYAFVLDELGAPFDGADFDVSDVRLFLLLLGR